MSRRSIVWSHGGSEQLVVSREMESASRSWATFNFADESTTRGWLQCGRGAIQDNQRSLSRQLGGWAAPQLGERGSIDTQLLAGVSETNPNKHCGVAPFVWRPAEAPWFADAQTSRGTPGAILLQMTLSQDPTQ